MCGVDYRCFFDFIFKKSRIQNKYLYIFVRKIMGCLVENSDLRMYER